MECLAEANTQKGLRPRIHASVDMSRTPSAYACAKLQLAIRGFAPITPVPPSARNRAHLRSAGSADGFLFWHCPKEKTEKASVFHKYHSLADCVSKYGLSHPSADARTMSSYSFLLSSYSFLLSSY